MLCVCVKVSADMFVYCVHAWYLKRASYSLALESQVLVNHLILGASDQTRIFYQE